jgi:glycosyltransferase involved in cell wall biosynthesis
METIGKRTDIKARIAKANWKLMNSERCVFIAYTRWQESFYRSLGIKNIRIIPHGIDPGVFDVERSQGFARKYGPGEYNILCVGNIDPRKGQHYLIESMPDILKEFPGAKLFLVGRAFYDHQIAYKKRLEEEIRKTGISEHVVFLNDAPRDELIQLYKWSDVFAFPTDAELFSIVILEALAAGLPIIATDRPYIREPLQDGKAGILASRDTKSFRDGIIELLGDKALRGRISANERKAVDEQYHLKKVVGAHWDLYRSLLER